MKKMQAITEPVLTDLDVHVDDRGLLYEVVHNYDLPPKQASIGEEYSVPYASFGQCYVVENPKAGTIRAFHRHEVLYDFFSIVHGAAIFCLVGPESKETRRLVLSARKPQMLAVPPGWWHGWCSLVDDSILLSVGSELYSQENPDEERVPPDHFDDLFEHKPFEIQFK